MDTAARGRSLHGYSLNEVTTFISCGLPDDLLTIVGLVPLSLVIQMIKQKFFSFGNSDGSEQFSANCYCIFGVIEVMNMKDSM